MSEGEPTPAPPVTAGGLLRRAREAQGLHIAALAASLKVPQRKLEALERDEYGALPDPAFTRALAQSICRTLKIDAAPVLALLPKAHDAQLEHVASGLNMPFRDHDGAGPPWSGPAARPVPWIVGLILLGAIAVAFWPSGQRGPLPVPAPAASEAALPAMPEASAALPASGPMAGAAVAPAVDAASAASSPAAAAAPEAAEPSASAPPQAGPLALRATSPSWVQVTDADGRVLLSRTLQTGETVGLDGTMPMRLTIGNAAATEVRLRGEAVDLAPHTRENIARFDLR